MSLAYAASREVCRPRAIQPFPNGLSIRGASSHPNPRKTADGHRCADRSLRRHAHGASRTALLPYASYTPFRETISMEMLTAINILTTNVSGCGSLDHLRMPG